MMYLVEVPDAEELDADELRLVVQEAFGFDDGVIEATTVVEDGYLCIQGYPKRICSGCTSGCCQPVIVVPLYATEDTPHQHVFEERPFWGTIVRRCPCGAQLDSKGVPWVNGKPER